MIVLEFENYSEVFMVLKVGKGDVLMIDNVIFYGMVK